MLSDETRRIFAALYGKFNDNILREIILASAGVKASRTCLDDTDLSFFLEVAEQTNLQVAVSAQKYVHRPDVGKGGWSNSLAAVMPADSPDGLFNVYIASDSQLSESGMSLEELSDENGFGALLSIPPCCIAAYVRFHPEAQKKQNDFVPIVLENSSDRVPYPFWNNYVSQYFGAALLSFFPCSFDCVEAAGFAQMTFTILQQCSEEWANSFIRIQQTNILYTEYLGLHMFPNAPYYSGWVRYAPQLVRSTEATRVGEQIARGNRLRVLGKHSVEIYNGDQFIDAIAGDDVSMCLFA
jgi:hypothetical protein